ncbi:DNA cytosine methyltransferase [Mucispirillum schaedleri]|uniref:DNA cytosine methyltransferase n=1 Tax=Mucispirillum schaedleri TaxID=248039 RepID=UPI001F584F5A|nr:DNA cytosine methyltransferase [Mucispirillum schaedleri]
MAGGLSPSFFLFKTGGVKIKKRLGKVISCFAGLGCGELALKNCGIEVKEMYAYEIDKYAEAVNRFHNPETQFLGDITKWESHKELIGGNVDLIMGGSPCQDLSVAGKRAGLNGARSGLVFVFAELVKHYKPRYFFLENVASMTKADREVITELMGVEPLEITSAPVSAQHRRRLYWTNIPYITPQPQGLTIKDILEDEPKGVLYYEKERVFLKNSPVNCSTFVRQTGRVDNRTSQGYRIYDINGKLPALDTRQDRIKIPMPEGSVRSLSNVEMERAFTLPDDYTATGLDNSGSYVDISKTMRGKMIGNGWVVKVIEQFFRSIE